MPMTWYNENPALLEKIREALQQALPEFFLHVEGDKMFARGRLSLAKDAKLYGRYLVEFEFSENYPKDPPTVREIGNKIAPSPERHMELGGKACLYYPDAQWQYYSEETTFVEFIDRVVMPFFWGQVYFDRKGKWPYPARAHFEAGALDYYKEELETDNVLLISKLLNYMIRKDVSKNAKCPCGSGKKFRKCHKESLDTLKTKISRDKLERSLLQVNSVIQSRR